MRREFCGSRDNCGTLVTMFGRKKMYIGILITGLILLRNIFCDETIMAPKRCCKVEEHRNLFYLKGNLLGENRGLANVESQTECASYCMDNQRCQGATYMADIRTCALHSSKIEQKDLKGGTGNVRNRADTVHLSFSCDDKNNLPKQPPKESKPDPGPSAPSANPPNGQPDKVDDKKTENKTLNRPTKELIAAAINNDGENIKTLIEERGIEPNEKEGYGWTALQVAAFRGTVESIKALLINDANVNAVDEYPGARTLTKNEPKHAAAIMTAREEHFGNEKLNNSQNYRGTTALHYAAIANQKEVIRVLCDSDADPTIENEAGFFPIDYASDDETKQTLKECTEKYEEEKKLRVEEDKKMFPLAYALKEGVVGQESPIFTVAAAIRRRETGWADDGHPLVFLFLGSSGTGKTELAKQVATYISKKSNQTKKDKDKDKDGFIRLDMSEYQSNHEVSKFIGAPPGYQGYEDTGQLTKKLTENPKAIVLFDEIEKAHTDILTILLQLFDEGRITDGKGNTVLCPEAIFIMTSNLASEEITKNGERLREEMARVNRMRAKGLAIESTMLKHFKDTVVQPVLKKHFKRDEFLGRITEMVYFLPFSRSEVIQLVIREMESWKKKAKKNHSVDLTWDRHVLEVMADGYNYRYGARSIKNEVGRRIGTELASANEIGLITKGCKVHLVTNLPEDAKDRSNAAIKLEISPP